MKVVILAGGLGTRLSEETVLKPKPMVEIGGKPILWHIMKYYSHFGHNDFIICCGYKGYVIKEFFANYFLHSSDVTIDLEHNDIFTHERHSEPWRVSLIDTGEQTMTGGRLLRVKKYLKNETFMLTYGDGLCNVNIDELLKTHKEAKRMVTVTAVEHPSRFGVLDINGESDIQSFEEKPEGDGKYINGGFMVCEPELLDFIDGDSSPLEKTALPLIANQHKMAAYKHHGFWYAMDTLRDKNYLESLWVSNQAKWKVW
jgi:glucose-1-phosphate cytidylyltransferase